MDWKARNVRGRVAVPRAGPDPRKVPERLGALDARGIAAALRVVHLQVAGRRVGEQNFGIMFGRGRRRRADRVERGVIGENERLYGFRDLV